jgi:hypothetical protein
MEREPTYLLKMVEAFMNKHPNAVKCPICAKSQFIKVFSLNEFDFPGTVAFNCYNPECLFASKNNTSVSFAISYFEKLISAFEDLPNIAKGVRFDEGSNVKITRQKDGKYRVNVGITQ